MKQHYTWPQLQVLHIDLPTLTTSSAPQSSAPLPSTPDHSGNELYMYSFNRTVWSIDLGPSCSNTTEDWMNSTLASLPQEASMLTIIVVSILVSILSLLTAGGNLLVMLSIRMDSQLQTISNYYLFSLSVADFTIGAVSMPLYTLYLLLNRWPLGPLVCDTWLSLDYTMSNASVANLLIISFDRYFSVTRPLSYRVNRTTRQAIATILIAWIISAAIWTPLILGWPHIDGQRAVAEGQCFIQFLVTNEYITTITALLAFYLPVSIMSIIYYRIYRATETRRRELAILQPATRGASIIRRLTSRRRRPREAPQGTQPRSTPVTLVSCTNGEGLVYDRDRQIVYQTLSNPSQISASPGEIRDERREDCGTDSEMDAALSRAEGLGRNGLEECLPLYKAADPNEIEVITRDGEENIVVELDPSLVSGSDVNLTELREGSVKDSQFNNEYNPPDTLRTDCDPPNTGGIHIQQSVSSTSTQLLSPSPNESRTSSLRVSNQVVNRLGIGGRSPITTLERRAGGGAGQGGSAHARRRQESKAAKTLSAILLAFIITWTPYNVLTIAQAFCGCDINEYLYSFSYWLCYLNSTVNPLCYALCNATFRRTYWTLLTCRWASHSRRIPPSTPLSATTMTSPPTFDQRRPRSPVLRHVS